MSATDTTERHSSAAARALWAASLRGHKPRSTRASDGIVEREAPLEDAIIEALVKAGCFVQKTGDDTKFGRLIREVQEYLYRVGLKSHVGNITAIIRSVGNANDPGIADLLVHAPGMCEGALVGVEVKTPKGKLKPDQVLAKKAGALIVCRSPEEAMAAVRAVAISSATQEGNPNG